MIGRRINGGLGVAVALSLVFSSCSGSDSAGDAEGPLTTAPASSDAPATSAAPAPETSEPTSSAVEVEAQDHVTGDSSFLYDQSEVHTFEITISEEALAVLDADPAAEEYVDGELTFNGEPIGAIGVRYKGSIGAFVGCTEGPNPFEPSGAKTCTKLSMKLKMNWDDPDAEFYGVRRVQLHSQNLDPTLLHERLGYWLFGEMGVPAPRSTHARVIVNGEYMGVFALTEEIDGRFTRENFEDGRGNLYKEVWPFDGDGEPHEEPDFIAGLETNEDDDPTAEIIVSFAEALANASPDEAIDVIAEWSDTELLLRTFVVDRAIRHDDGALHWYCLGACAPHNFYWYEDPSSRQVSLIPWDLDNAFDNLGAGTGTSAVTRIADPWGQVSNDCQPFPYGPLNILQRSAACDPLIAALATLDTDYDRIRAELVAGPMSEESIRRQVDMWTAQIEPAVAEAAATHDDAPSVAAWRAAVERLVDEIVASLDGSGR